MAAASFARRCNRMFRKLCRPDTSQISGTLRNYNGRCGQRRFKRTRKSRKRRTLRESAKGGLATKNVSIVKRLIRHESKVGGVDSAQGWWGYAEWLCGAKRAGSRARGAGAHSVRSVAHPFSRRQRGKDRLGHLALVLKYEGGVIMAARTGCGQSVSFLKPMEECDRCCYVYEAYVGPHNGASKREVFQPGDGHADSSTCSRSQA